MPIGRIVILSGPSGSGKTSLYQQLLNNHKFKGKLVKSVSLTTRPKRPGEKQGRDYYFVSHHAFLYKRRTKQLLESQKVFNYYYGTPRKPVERLLKKGRNVLLCIDVKGAKSALRQYPDALRIFINAPTMAELKQRLRKRGTEDKLDFDLRLKIACKEIKEAKHYDFVIVNDKLTAAYKKLEEIVCKQLKIF
jgi:guanylate kinase